MNIPIVHCDDLEAVDTTPQEQLNACYIRLLEERVRSLQQTMMRAQVYLAINEPQRAGETLSQGLTV